MWDAWELELRRRGERPATLRQYHQHVAPFVAGVPGWRTATAADLERWLDSRRGRDGGPLAAKTRRWWVTWLRHWYRHAVAVGVVTVDPTGQLTVPRMVEREPRPVSEDDAAMLLARAPGWGPVGRCITLMLREGLRAGEVSRLRWGDVDPWAMTVRVDGKGGRERTLPWRADLVDALGPAGAPGEPVIGATWSPAQVSRQVRLVLRREGIHRRVHDLRVAAGTAVWRSSRDADAVRRFLGHTSFTPTMRYIAGDQDALRHAVADAVYRGGNGTTPPTGAGGVVVAGGACGEQAVTPTSGEP